MLVTLAIVLFVVANTKSALRSGKLAVADSNAISVKSPEGRCFYFIFSF